MPFKISPTDEQWIASLLNSDGYVGIHRTSKKSFPRLLLTSTKKHVIDRVVEITGKPARTPIVSSSGEPIYSWQDDTARQEVLRQILPYLSIVRKQAKLVLELADRMFVGIGEDHETGLLLDDERATRLEIAMQCREACEATEAFRAETRSIAHAAGAGVGLLMIRK